MPRHMDIAFGDVLYRPAYTAFEYRKNPDVEELLARNKEAQQRECEHAQQTCVYNDETGQPSYNICRACTKRLPPRRTDRMGWPQ